MFEATTTLLDGREVRLVGVEFQSLRTGRRVQEITVFLPDATFYNISRELDDEAPDGEIDVRALVQ